MRSDTSMRAREPTHGWFKVLLFLGALAVASATVSLRWDIPLSLPVAFGVGFVSIVVACTIFATRMFRESKKGAPTPIFPEVDMLAVLLTAGLFAFSVLAGFFVAALFGPPSL